MARILDINKRNGYGLRVVVRMLRLRIVVRMFDLTQIVNKILYIQWE